MNNRNHSTSQTMHSNINSYDSYAPPLRPPAAQHPSTFDDFLSMQQPPAHHWYDHNHFGVFAVPPHPPMTSFADIPPITSFNFKAHGGAMHNDNDAFIGYHRCARMEAFDTGSNIRNEMEFGCRDREFQSVFPADCNPLPPVIDNAQSIEAHHSFCSEASNATNSTIATNPGSAPCDNKYAYCPLSFHPPPIYRFKSDYKHVSNQVYEDDLSSTSCTSFNGTIKQSPLFPSDHLIKTESPNTMMLAETSTSVKKKSNKDAKPWVCPECGNRYKYKSSMKLHFKVHTKDAKVCKECGKKFPHDHKLRIHMRSHTGERPFKCDICPKAFSDKSNLNRHKRLHTGEKPYQCEFCYRRYSDSSALVDHRRRKHTKEKPYECQFCHNKFAASSDLTSHLAVHSDIRPFECEQCHKRFKRRSDVHKHLKTHQPKAGK